MLGRNDHVDYQKMFPIYPKACHLIVTQREGHYGQHPSPTPGKIRKVNWGLAGYQDTIDEA